VAAHVDQERRVVHDRASFLVEPDALGRSEGDRTRTEDVLHRLPEAEVDSKRRRGHEIGKADAARRYLGRHEVGPPTA